MTSNAVPPMGLRSALMLLGLATVWGGSFFLAEIALSEVPPMTLALHRIFWATPVLALIVWLKGIAVPRSMQVWGAYLVMGALNNVIPFSLIFWGQTHIESGLAAILNSTTAVFGAVVAGLLLADEPLTARKTVGAVLGVAGVAVIMGPDALTSFDLGNLGQLAILGASLSYSFASVWGKAALADQPPLMNALGMLTCSAILAIPIALAVDGPPTMDISIGVWGALLALSVLSTAFAYILYFAILVRAGAANLMLVTLLIPPLAIALGASFLDERIGPEAWAGFAVIAVGLAVTDGRVFAMWRPR